MRSIPACSVCFRHSDRYPVETDEKYFSLVWLSSQRSASCRGWWEAFRLVPFAFVTAIGILSRLMRTILGNWLAVCPPPWSWSHLDIIILWGHSMLLLRGLTDSTQADPSHPSWSTLGRKQKSLSGCSRNWGWSIGLLPDKSRTLLDTTYYLIS